MAAWQPVGESADCHKIQQNQSFIRDTNSVFGRLENNGLRPEMGHSSVPEKENPDALAGAVGADLHGSSVAADDSLKRIEAARALAAAVSEPVCMTASKLRQSDQSGCRISFIFEYQVCNNGAS